MKKTSTQLKWHPLQLNSTTCNIIKQILEILETKNKFEN